MHEIRKHRQEFINVALKETFTPLAIKHRIFCQSCGHSDRKREISHRNEVGLEWCDECFAEFYLMPRREAKDEYRTQEHLRYYGII